VANAQDHPPMPPGGPGLGQQQMRFQMPNFADLDKNKDKKLSRDEMSNMPPQFFDRLDENRDGFIDEEEFNRIRGGGRMMGGPRVGESLVKLLDADKDTRITKDEFAGIVALFDALDQDRNGDLSQDELNGFFRAVNEAPTKATGGVNTTSAFDKMDKNKDGKISADEADERMFRNLDLNKDGSVTREEFEKAVKQMADRSKAQASAPADQKKP
jgi:Ca2+-binding EF-hand superfamily protein